MSALAASPPGYIDGGIMVAIQFGAAGTGMPSVGQRFFADNATAATGLAGETGVDEQDVATDACSLIDTTLHELPPPNIANGQRKTMVLQGSVIEFPTAVQRFHQCSRLHAVGIQSIPEGLVHSPLYYK